MCRLHVVLGVVVISACTADSPQLSHDVPEPYYVLQPLQPNNCGTPQEFNLCHGIAHKRVNELLLAPDGRRPVVIITSD